MTSVLLRLSLVLCSQTTIHAQDFDTLHRTGVTLLEQGHFGEAERTLRLAMSVGEQQIDRSAMPTAMLSLVWALLVQEKFGEADRLLSRALSRISQSGSPLQRDAAGPLRTLAALYWAAGRYREAGIVGQRALSIAGLDHPESAFILATLGLIMKEQRKTAEAVLHFERALAILEPTQAAELPALLYMLGLARFQQKEFDKAAELYLRALACESSGPHLIANLKSALGTVQMKRGLREEGHHLSSEAVMLAREVYPTGHWSLAAILHEHAQILRALGRKQEAKAMEIHAKSIYKDSSSGRILPPRIDIRALQPKQP